MPSLGHDCRLPSPAELRGSCYRAVTALWKSPVLRNIPISKITTAVVRCPSPVHNVNDAHAGRAMKITQGVNMFQKRLVYYAATLLVTMTCTITLAQAQVNSGEGGSNNCGNLPNNAALRTA